MVANCPSKAREPIRVWYPGPIKKKLKYSEKILDFFFTPCYNISRNKGDVLSIKSMCVKEDS